MALSGPDLIALAEVSQDAYREPLSDAIDEPGSSYGNLVPVEALASNS